MRLFSEFHGKDLEEHIERALFWYADHAEHVDKLVKEVTTSSIEPSGSDCARPELFKDIHWKWFLNTYKKLL